MEETERNTSKTSGAIGQRCLLCLTSECVNFLESIVPGNSLTYISIDDGGNEEESSWRWYSKFILRKLLDIPEERCDLLREGVRIFLCESCAKLVAEALELHQNLLILTRKLEGIRRQVRGTLREGLGFKEVDAETKGFDQEIWEWFQRHAGIRNTEDIEKAKTIPGPDLRCESSSLPPSPSSSFNGGDDEDPIDETQEPNDVEVKSEVDSDDNVEESLGVAEVWEQNDDDEGSWKPEEGSDSERSMSELSEPSDSASDTEDSEEEKRERPKAPPRKRKKPQVSPTTKFEATPKTPKKRIRVSILPKKGSDKFPAICDICNWDYPSYYAYKAHVFNHKFRTEFSCDLCKFVAGSQKLLHRHHLKAHNKPHPEAKVTVFTFVCDKCDFKTNHPTHGYYHRRAHKVTDNFEYIDGDKWIRCKLCGFEGNKAQCYKHMRDAHSLAARNYSKKPFYCEICDKTLSTVGGLKFHMQKVHEKLPKYTCETCGKGFIHKSQLDDHTAMHENNGLGTYICKDCGARFVSRASLNSHDVKYHRALRMQSLKESGAIGSKVEVAPGTAKLKPGSCRYCGESFLSQSVMLEHQRVSHRELFVACQFCDVLYKSRLKMTEHLEKKHNIARDSRERLTHYKGTTCMQCGAIFRYAKLRLEHQKKEHLEMFEKCDKCDAIYMTKTAMNCHMRKQHGVVSKKKRGPPKSTAKRKKAPAELQQ